MGMDMDTAAMGRIAIRGSARLFVVCCVVSYTGLASAEVTFTPYAQGDITYTDNVDLTPSDKQDSGITTLSTGIGITSDGNDGSLALNYQLRKLLYSHDSIDNELYNELSFTADKGLSSQTQLKANASASISNIARNIEQDANDDIITGDTIETKSFGAGLTYQNSSDGIASLSASADTSVTLNEDGIGDNNSYSGSVNLDQGQAIKDIFWSTDYSYTTNIGRDDGSRTQTHQFSQELGLQQIYGFSPFVSYTHENYLGATDEDSADRKSVV